MFQRQHAPRELGCKIPSTPRMTAWADALFFGEISYSKAKNNNPLLSAQTVLDAHGKEANVCSLLSWLLYPRTP